MAAKDDLLVTVGGGSAYYNIYDEDDMSSDSATGLATQQSIKAYVGSQVGAAAVRYLEGVIADVSTAEVVYLPAPVAGTITSLRTVLEGAITVADAIITPKINGVAVTGGAITIANSGSAAGDTDSATPTAANTIAAGDYITVETDGGSTGAQRVWFVIEITES